MFRKTLLAFLLLFTVLFSQPSIIFCEETIDGLNNKIEEYSQKLIELNKAKDTLSNQIKILDSQVALTLLKINQTENTIKILEEDIRNLAVKIDQLDTYLNQLSSAYIDQVSQNYKLQKHYPSFAYFFSSKFNKFLEQYKYLSVVQKNSQDNLLAMETARTNFDIQKTEKSKKQAELEELQKTLASQKNNLTRQKLSKDNLLQVTKNDEKIYQQLLAEAQSQLRLLRNFSSTAGGASCLASSPGKGSDGMFFSQRDPEWCKFLIGNSQDTVGAVGCYISSISMAYRKIGNTSITPKFYANDPLNFTLNTAYAKNPIPPSGYKYEKVRYNSNIIDNELKNGRYVITEVKMSGSVSGVHFFVIIGGSEGNYKIHDPWFGSDQNLNSYYSTSSIVSLRLITK